MYEIEKKLTSLLEEANRNIELKIREMSLVSRIALASTKADNLRKITQEILQVVIDETPAENCSIWLKGWPEERLFLFADLDCQGQAYFIDPFEPARSWSRRLSLAMGEGVVGQVARDRRPVLYGDLGGHARLKLGQGIPGKVGSMLALPLIVGAKCIGVLALTHPLASAFKSDDLRVLIIVANHAANQLQKSILLRELNLIQTGFISFFEFAQEPLVIGDRSGGVISFNAAALQFFGLSEAEAHGSRLYTLFGSQAWGLIVNAIDELSSRRLCVRLPGAEGGEGRQVDLSLFSFQQGGLLTEPKVAIMLAAAPTG